MLLGCILTCDPTSASAMLTYVLYIRLYLYASRTSSFIFLRHPFSMSGLFPSLRMFAAFGLPVIHLKELDCCPVRHLFILYISRIVPYQDYVSRQFFKFLLRELLKRAVLDLYELGYVNFRLAAPQRK